MDDYVCITVLSNPGEPTGEFSARLSRFWTHLLRTRKDQFEKVYAETTSFERKGECHTRQYLIECEIIPMLEAELRTKSLEFEPIDPDDLYSKYEASPPHWMQIEH
jgi:hypothetical protein